MKNKIMIAIVAIVLPFMACKKPEKGEAGTPGKDGNANVSSVTLNATAWTWDGGNYWRTAYWINIPILTSSVVNGGAVMLYQKDTSTGLYAALPLTINVTSTVQEHDFFVYSTTGVQVYIEKSDLSDPNPAPAQYKLVCIPPAIIKQNPKLDLTNYSEVEKLMDLNN